MALKEESEGRVVKTIGFSRPRKTGEGNDGVGLGKGKSMSKKKTDRWWVGRGGVGGEGSENGGRCRERECGGKRHG